MLICTLNPDREVLARVLAALEAQTLARGAFEILLVDNCSQPPLARAEFPAVDRVVREARPGVAFARARAIREARAPLLLFADDDNLLAPNYLETALAIAAANPGIGAFSGIAEPVVPEGVPAWTRPLWPALGIRDHGPEAITRASDEWGPWLPIGAGCAVRREPALRYAALIWEGGLGEVVGRAGDGIVAGEDTLLAWTAVWDGYACSYQPSLRLAHCLRRSRFSWRNLARNEFGHGVAFVRLEALRGRPVVTGGMLRRLLNLAWSLGRRIRELGLRAGLIRWCWDLGVSREAPLPDLPPVAPQRQPLRSGGN